jgi:Uma2 family endonuclease
MNALSQDRLSVEQFLSWLPRQEGRYELVNGQIRMMTGAANRHNIAKDNVAAALHSAARSHGCRSTSSDTGVRTGELSLRYPDVVVDCGPPDLDGLTVATPTILVAVSSPGTRETDISVKLYEYQNLPSVQIIIQIEPDIVFVTVHRRAPDGSWQLEVYDSLDDIIDLPPLSTSLPMRDIYAGLDVKPRRKLQVVGDEQ